MAKRRQPVPISDDQVRALLERYACPMPFHQVRTRFLGNIASPVLTASPMQAVRELWGGELPEFADMAAVNELIGALVMGLWNRLTRHQDRAVPFRLVRVALPETQEGLHRLSLIRSQEIDGFVHGLFGSEEAVDLPKRAHKALDNLSKGRGLLEGIHHVTRPTVAPAVSDIAAACRMVRELSRKSEHEIQEAVIACTRARRQMISQQRTPKPTLH
jgi:hypothetical protein